MDSRVSEISRTAVVVIPTYNELDTIPKLVEHLFDRTFPTIVDWEMHVLIVDGNSPDGTAGSIRALMPRYPNLHLMVEQEKEGIGAAYFKGFRYAEADLKADVLIEFDGDFQHPPETIPLMLETIDGGAELVLGSRNRKGGSVPRQWGLRRLFLSKVGGLVARFLLFFPTRRFFQVTDPTTGLKATRIGSAYHELDFDRFISKSFGYKLEMLFHLLRKDIRVEEVPLQFRLRRGGESKIEPSTAGEMLKTVVKLRLNDPASKRFIKFALVGFVGYVVNALAVELFARTSLTSVIAQKFTSDNPNLLMQIIGQQSSWSAAFATELAIMNNFTWNNLWTFNRRRIRGWRIIKKFLHFNMTSLGAIVLQAFAVGTATLLLGNTALVRQVSLVLAIGLLVVPYNWIMYNLVIWRKDAAERSD